MGDIKVIDQMSTQITKIFEQLRALKHTGNTRTAAFLEGGLDQLYWASGLPCTKTMEIKQAIAEVTAPLPEAEGMGVPTPVEEEAAPVIDEVEEVPAAEAAVAPTPPPPDLPPPATV